MVLDKGASNDWTDNRSYGPSAQDNGKVLGTVPQWHDITEDYLAECDDTSTADTLDASTDEHNSEVICDSTKYCSNREEDEREDEELLAAEVLGDGSDDRLEYCARE
ncbi:hypothetical protein SLS60_008086 [Paraconiothyrium brasiliense]|uniref:Uncharacterized protein n=1 Tax=Paraconiothyrium brasiliense TaxID=300254 RepID=A0ABR3R3E1_9PLEO